ncbi:MAG: LamG domain-containing protein, partial [Planctomycetota bacterium]
MCKKLVYLTSFVLVMSLAGNAFTADDPSLIIYYSFDDVGEIVADQSGKGHDGTVVGDITAETGGKVNGAAKFEGRLGAAGESYLDLDGPSFPAEDIPTSGMTLAAWIKCDNTGGHHAIFNARAGDSTWLVHPEARSNGEFRWLLRAYGGTTIFDIRSGVVPWGEWVHFAGIYDKASAKAYTYNNGELVGEANVNPPLDIAGDYDQGARVGYNIDAARPFTGIMDELFLYKRALSQAEVKTIMQGLDFPYAFSPDPADGAMHEDTWATLAWSPGSSAVSHDVYFGDNLNDVKDGTGDTFQGNQIPTFLIVGFPGFAYPDGLVPGTTYYWRIDEIEADGTTRKGDIWSFAIPPKTAYNPDPPDGAEFVDPNVELSWTKGFGAMLHTVYFGDNFDDVDSATGGTSQGGATYTPGPLELEKVYYWRVDEFDAANTYKGDVWSFTTPGAAGSPVPSNGAMGVKMTPTLSWTPADNAASHEVYFGTDKDTVRNATTASPEYQGSKALGSESYDPGKLDWYATYYWRVDAVYDSAPDNPVKGLAWSFTTADFISVDDFESYNDLNPDDPASNRIFTAWLDGLDDPANGSVVGYDTAPFAEQTIVHGGSQSMPLLYDNSVGYSEASMTLVSARDWTEEGVTKLSLWFHGDAANSAERMFVALNGNAVVYHDDSAATQTGEWTEWVIGLKAFADQGVDLTNVDTISIGFGDKNNPQTGGSGKMYIDDIRLYRPAAPVDPGTEGLAAFYALDGDANDSSGNGNDGTINNPNGGLGPDGSVWVDDPERGTVISFNGTAEGAFVRAGEIPQMTLTNDFTWAFWAKHSDENTADNDIILGNRMDENAVDFVPRQFIKFTPTKFEWHMNGNGNDNLDYDDIPADVWLHHAVVKTADQLTYYRNGIEASSGTFTQALDFPQPLFFGGDNEAAAGENWSGLMSEVGIYNRALSEAEIRYLAGFRSTTEAVPVGHWTLDEGAGTMVADVSGNGNDGTIVGNPTGIPGILGTALEFHGLGAPGGGGDYIDCGNDASLDIPGPISIALWIKPGADDPEGQGTETAP